MQSERFLHAIDGISTWVGKAAAWLIVVLMLAVCVEVFKRYMMDMPTAWIFDLTNMLYGSLFMLCGAYTLAQNAHVRGDFLYSSMKPRTQASLDLVLYIVFFVPAIAALIYAGTDYAADSWRINEHSNVTANGPPIYHFKDRDPDRRRAGDVAGPRRNRPLRHLPENRRVADPSQGRRRDGCGRRTAR